MPGGPGFTLAVRGTGFVSGATVDWNGAPLTTAFVSRSQLSATVPAENIAKAGTASVSVANPSPNEASNVDSSIFICKQKWFSNRPLSRIYQGSKWKRQTSILRSIAR